MDQLLLKLNALGIDIRVDKGQLRLNVPKDFTDTNILEEVRAYKQDLIAFISERTNINAIKNIPKASNKEFHQLSPAQRRIFILHEIDKKSLAYNMPHILKIHGKVNVQVLNSIFKQLIERHESLRTSFKVLNDEPVQKIENSFEFQIEEFENESESVVINRFIRPFNLSKAPLFRVGLLSLRGDEYLLLIDIHHLIFDGVSFSILINDFVALYTEVSLQPVNLQYRDYSEWLQHDNFKLELLRQKEFWHSIYKEEVSTLDLPNDYSRPLNKSFNGSSLSFELDKESTENLSLIADMQNSTLFVIMLSVFKVLLSKLSNQEDIIIGTPTAGRIHADLESTIGMFVNTLPLRTNVAGHLSFLDLVSELKRHTLASFDNQSYPYEELVDELNIPRNSSRNPLFDVMFVYQNLENSLIELPDLELSAYHNNLNFSKFDLTLSLGENDGKLSLNFTYSTDLFKCETIERFILYLKNIVKSVILNPQISISEIDILPPKEKDRLLNVFNDNALAYSKDSLIHEIFQEESFNSPEKVAVICNGQSISYKELNERSNQLANYLSKKGIGEGEIIGLLMIKSIDLVVSILGVLKTGAAYLPMDIHHPANRNRYVVESSGIKSLIVTKTTDEVNDLGVNIISVENEEITNESIDYTAPSLNGDNMAYILYTSGSTGIPKGVMIKHSAVLNLIASQTKEFAITKEDNILQFSTVIFDASVEQTWLALLNGATLVLLDNRTITDNKSFNEFLKEHSITHLHATPSFFRNSRFVKW
ncbi:non-ribosomal peptide synthetase [Fulvivirga maritima]|uniref:non-ribosomal peptide synthetase n=1 Tax=Fulvivirga maritima TaxID=2904247 RepID=UPI002102956B|nr:condensation domain-containing protein [Fulvivirga maritima]